MHECVFAFVCLLMAVDRMLLCTMPMVQICVTETLSDKSVHSYMVYVLTWMSLHEFLCVWLHGYD